MTLGDIQLTTDIFIGSIIAIMAAYSFIIGRNGVIRIIFSTYFAMLAADGFGMLITNHILTVSPILSKIAEMIGAQGSTSMKIFMFILIIVISTIRGPFTIDLPQEKSLPLRLVSTGFVGLLSANLIISVIIVYIAGGSFIKPSLESDLNLITIYEKSVLAQKLIENFDISFFLPVATFLILGLIYNEN